MAVDDDILVKNPFGFQLAGVLVNDAVTREVIYKDQMRKFLKFVHDDVAYCKYYEVVYILFHTGMRISEFCGLTLKDIDLEKMTVNIDHQLQRTSDMRYIIETTKTDNVKTDIKVKDEKGATRQRLYSDKFLSENYPQFSDVNDLPEIKGFLEHYYDIGNIIPTWPGANINRGMAHCYDIPNVYYKRHAKFTKLVYGSIYRSVFIEEILENDKYDTVEKLLKLKPEQYVKFLEYIVDVIINRNKQLQDILQEENGHE